MPRSRSKSPSARSSGRTRSRSPRGQTLAQLEEKVRELENKLKARTQYTDKLFGTLFAIGDDVDNNRAIERGEGFDNQCFSNGLCHLCFRERNESKGKSDVKDDGITCTCFPNTVICPDCHLKDEVDHDCCWCEGDGRAKLVAGLPCRECRTVLSDTELKGVTGMCDACSAKQRWPSASTATAMATNNHK